MPNSDVLNARLLLSNKRDGVLQPIWKGFSLGFKFNPTVLELTMSPVVYRLPVVINNEIGDIDFVFGKNFNRLKNLVLG